MITITNDFIYAAISQIYEEDGEVRVNRFQLSLRVIADDDDDDDVQFTDRW